MMPNQATRRHGMNAPFAYAITIPMQRIERIHHVNLEGLKYFGCNCHSPSDASVGPDEINDPRRSGRATSVIYTIAGLVPMAEPKPVKMRPINNVGIFVAVAIKIQPITQGIDAHLIVFNRPIHSISTPAIRQPGGTARTITDATHDVCAGVNLRSLSSASTCGVTIAENASAIPITIWNEAAATAEKI